ncbi:odorant receptor Or2-like [Periplaneta americana]|uniref:odorant receptor Or2-like n=1 Tax=Periplaneta americana TaxID=6978 RepID=UPI0037E7C111
MPNAINRDSEDVLIGGICLNNRLYQEEMQRYLGCCVEQHQKILKIVEELNAVLSVVMMTLILSSAGLFAFLGMLLASATDSAVIVMAATALIYCVMETGLICWIANNLTTQSEMVGEASYNCGWYDASKKFNTSISLIIMRAQRPALLSVGPFGTLSLELFGKIMNSAYSYFTLLKNANGK